MNVRRSWFKRIVLLSFTILTAMLAGCASDSSNTESLNIYEIWAMKASFTSVAGDSTATQFQVSLSNSFTEDDQVLYFTNRGAQRAGTMSLGSLVTSVWPRIYGSVAPNAILQGTTASNETVYISCIVDKPVLNKTTGQLDFSITYLDGRRPDAGLALTDVQLIITNNSATVQPALWSHNLDGATGTLEPSSTNDGSYTFRIQKAAGTVYGITCAPQRKTEMITTSEYINSWNIRYGTISPNVSISYTDSSLAADGGVFTATLSNPMYDVFSDSISFKATNLYSPFGPIGKTAVTLQAPTVFIDGADSPSLPVTISNRSGRDAYIKIIGNRVDVEPDQATIEKGPIKNGQALQFKINKLDAGRIYISYDNKLSYVDPDAFNTMRNSTRNDDYYTRFGWVEVTYKGGLYDVANLTANDFYALPIALETFKGDLSLGRLALADGKTGNMLRSALLGVVPAGADSPEIKTDAGMLRILAPVKKPQSYKSFDDLLKALPSGGTSFTISGKFFGGATGHANSEYNFTGTADATNIILTGTADNDNRQHTLKISLQSLMSDPKGIDLIHYYGIFTCNGTFDVDGTIRPVSGKNQTTGYDYNDVYAAVYRDLVTAFNLGFIQAGIKNDSSTWWLADTVPFQGSYYNGYAKTIADYYPDAYGFAFSDRYKSLLTSLTYPIDKMTITLLGDGDTSPQPTFSGTKNPQSGDIKFNMSIETPDGSGFEKTKFSFNTKVFDKGGAVYTFPGTSPTSQLPANQNRFAQLTQVPAKKGLNAYDIHVLGTKTTLFVFVGLLNNKVDPATTWVTGAGSHSWLANDGTLVVFTGGF